MRYAMIDRNGLVVRTLEANEGNPPQFENYTMQPSETANVGDKFDGKNFVSPFTGRVPPGFRMR